MANDVSDQDRAAAENHYVERTKLKRDVVSLEEEFKNEIIVAFLAGIAHERAELLKDASEFDEAVFCRDWFRENGFMHPDKDEFRSNCTFQEVARYVARWAHERQRLREAALKAERDHWCDKYGRYVDKWNDENRRAEAALAEVERLNTRSRKLQSERDLQKRDLNQLIYEKDLAVQGRVSVEIERDRLKRELAEARAIISGKTFDDEVERLKAELAEANETLASYRLEGPVSTERERAKPLVEALEWYAQESVWENMSQVENDADVDSGDKARDALEAYRGRVK